MRGELERQRSIAGRSRCENHGHGFGGVERHVAAEREDLDLVGEEVQGQQAEVVDGQRLPDQDDRRRRRGRRTTVTGSPTARRRPPPCVSHMTAATRPARTWPGTGPDQQLSTDAGLLERATEVADELLALLVRRARAEAGLLLGRRAEDESAHAACRTARSTACRARAARWPPGSAAPTGSCPRTAGPGRCSGSSAAPVRSSRNTANVTARSTRMPNSRRRMV